jgi:hypothetical protein
MSAHMSATDALQDCLMYFTTAKVFLHQQYLEVAKAADDTASKKKKKKIEILMDIFYVVGN